MSNNNKVEDLANNHSVDDNVWSKESFIQGYNKSQETHPFSKEDMIEFALEVATAPNTPYKTVNELFQIWKEQQS